MKFVVVVIGVNGDVYRTALFPFASRSKCRMFLGPIILSMATDPFPSVHQHFGTAYRVTI